MHVLKKLITYTLITLFILILTSPLWIKVIPTKYIKLLSGKLALVDNVVCNFSINVAGESMKPLINPGSSVETNRCFADTDLVEGTVVLFRDDQKQRLGIIRHVLPLDPVIYNVSDEKAPELLHDVIKEEITGIVKGVDGSKSNYQSDQNTESLILNADEFLSDLYVGRIPRGYGVEMAEVEKTTQFTKEKDKFCSVIIPKKELVSVDIEIVNAETKEVVRSSKNIIFNVRSEPNVNCEDFGSGSGMLNLKSGTYQYRFLMKHQVLADVQFEVR